MMRRQPSQTAASLKKEISWNVVSFGIQGICLLGLQVLIARFFTVEDLGVFNQVFAGFIIFSQLAVGGVHLSAQKFISEDNTNTNRSVGVAQSALITTFGLALFWTLLFYASRNEIARFLGSPAVAEGIYFATVGLFFFAINKTLFAIVNGYQHMRLFSVLQALRALALVIGVVVLWYTQAPGSYLSAILSVSEIIVFVGLLPTLWNTCFSKSSLPIAEWIKTHLIFGTKGFLSGVLNEFNTRVDVLMLGYFMDDTAVGIYSFAAVFAEGLGQLTSVIRANYNPRLSRLLSQKNFTQLIDLIHSGRNWTYKIMLVVSLLAVATYPFITKMMTHNADLAMSATLFSILTLGIFLQSGYSPFMQLLLQGGRPGTYSIQVALVVLINVILNLVLIPLMGLSGAAIATTLSWGCSVFIFKSLVERYLELRV